jgi:hypothetical protein
MKRIYNNSMEIETYDLDLDSTTINQNLNEAFKLTQTIYLKEREEALQKLLTKYRRKRHFNEAEKTFSTAISISPVLHDHEMRSLTQKERGKLIELICQNPQTFYRHKQNKLFASQPPNKYQIKLPLQLRNRVKHHRRSSSVFVRAEDLIKSPSISPRFSPSRKVAERDKMNRKIDNILTACDVTRLKTPSLQLNRQIDKELNIVRAFKQRLDWTTDTLQELANNEGEILSNMYIHLRCAKAEEAIDRKTVAQSIKESTKIPATRPQNLSNVLRLHKNRLL